MKFAFEAIGTGWQIEIYKDLSKEEQQDILKKIQDRIEIFDKLYSRFRKDSLVSEIALKGGVFEMPEDGFALFALYQKFYGLTDGLMTPLVGQTLSDLGYDEKYSLEKKDKVTQTPVWEEVLEVKENTLTLKKPALLDFGAIGKGYLIDRVGEVIEENGFFSYAINAGGDILHKNNSPIRIGLEHPEDFSKVLGVFNLKNQSLAGSAGNRRKWKVGLGELSHIINPKTLSSPTNILAVWVLAENTALADALTTALYFTQPEILEKHFKFKYLIVYPDKSIRGSLLGNHMLELY